MHLKFSDKQQSQRKNRRREEIIHLCCLVDWEYYENKWLSIGGSCYLKDYLVHTIVFPRIYQNEK